MNVEITFTKKQIRFELTYTGNGEEILFSLLHPEKRTSSTFTINQADTLPVLNNCVSRLRNANNDGNAELDRKSLLTFIDEAVTHKEYCTSDMLRSLDYVLPYCLGNGRTSPNVWADKTYMDETTMLKWYSASATAKDIKEIYRKTHFETYLCTVPNVNEATALFVQVAYSLLLHIFKEGKIIKRCGNCGNLFIPTRASDKYCQRQTDGKTCSEIKKAEAQKRSHNKEEKARYKRIYNRLARRKSTKDLVVNFSDGFRNCNSEIERKQYLETWDRKYPSTR